MIDIVAWPALAMPKKSLIAALLAAMMVATTLVVAPVPLPLVGGVSEASAHTQRRCFEETVSVPVYGNPYSRVPTGYETRSQTTCVNVEHSHPEEVAITAGVVVATCGVASLYGPWFGVGCGVAFGTLAVVEATSAK
ncbi:MAG: hypothetical protein OXC00_08315 [Acidimicrobiaceae bacterium]|nr:hypothetical protein [Acidimicrobiaceae bacterium]